MVLLDTNVLVHAHAARSPFHAMARRVRDHAVEGTLNACVSPQVLCEFYAVCTNEKLMQPPLTPAQARHEVLAYWASPHLRKIVPSDSAVRQLLDLMAKHRVKGPDIFDTFLVATMLEHGVDTIYTQNTKDFTLYGKTVQVVNPFLSRTPASSP